MRCAAGLDSEFRLNAARLALFRRQVINIQTNVLQGLVCAVVNLRRNTHTEYTVGDPRRSNTRITSGWVCICIDGRIHDLNVGGRIRAMVST